MILRRAFRYRMSPTPEQEVSLRQFVGVTRLVYNLAFEQRRDWWRNYQRETGRAISWFSQSAEVKALRAEFDWIAAAPYAPMTQALRDLDRAFVSFFRGQSAYPTPRRKGENDSLRIMVAEVSFKPLNSKWSAVRIPKLGWVRFKRTREYAGRILSATVSLKAGRWFVSIACEIESEAQEPLPQSIGIDRGVANTLALSDGSLISTTVTTAIERRKRNAQRKLARKVRGSNRYTKQRDRLARISSRLRDVRVDWRHKVTTDLARRFGTVAIEDLKTANMTRSGKHKRGLNRSILEQGWGAFATVLEYKLEERGGRLVKVNPAYTSQTCSDCGTIDKASRESQASFACRHCGFAIHADTNAAINILRRSTASMRAEDRGYSTDETRTATLGLRSQGDADLQERACA